MPAIEHGDEFRAQLGDKPDALDPDITDPVARYPPDDGPAAGRAADLAVGATFNLKRGIGEDPGMIGEELAHESAHPGDIGRLEIGRQLAAKRPEREKRERTDIAISRNCS